MKCDWFGLAYPIAGTTVSLFASCSAFNGAAALCHCSRASSRNAKLASGAIFSVGRSAWYAGSVTGASRASVSRPPSRKTETSTVLSRAAPIASAMPSSNARGASAPPPNTASASPLERARNARRESPLPAGIGIPGSIARKPLPAAAWRRTVARVCSLQSHAFMGGPQQVW